MPNHWLILRRLKEAHLLCWLGARLLKIYRDEPAGNFYLHDETTGRLFAFAGDSPSLKTDHGYETLVATYRAWLADGH